MYIFTGFVILITYFKIFLLHFYLYLKKLIFAKKEQYQYND